MSLALEEISREAMALPIYERLALANQLLESAESLNEKSDEVSAAWESEIQDRFRAIDEGLVVGHPYEAVQQEVATLLAR